MPVLVVATTNQHKLSEIHAICGSSLHNLTIKNLSDFPPLPEVIEDQDSFIGNASKKALETARALNCLALADDSGLCVDALNGAPGIYSARYAGSGATSTDLCKKLLTELHEIPTEKRTAHFITAIALAAPNGILLTVEGRADGIILNKMRGAHGFGYDPVFFYPPLGKTFAELSASEKNHVSHRSRALQILKNKLPLTIQNIKQS